MRKLIIYLILLFIFLYSVSFLLTRYNFDGHLIFNIKGRISDINNNGIEDIKIYFSDADLMKNDVKIENEFIGKTNKDGRLLIKYGYPFSYTDFLFKKWIELIYPIHAGNFILTLEKVNYKPKELKFNIKNLKKDKNRIYLEIDLKMQENNLK